MQEEEGWGWLWRLPAKLCAPPIPCLSLNSCGPALNQRIERFGTAVWGFFVLGMFRSAIAQRFVVHDFMGGGTDLFGALLGIFAVHNCCESNGSLFATFLIWTVVNLVLFDVMFSAGPDVMALASSDEAKGPLVLDICLILFSVAVQIWLARAAHEILQTGLPDWMNLLAGTGTSSSNPQRLGQTLLAPPRQDAMRSGPAAAQTFKAFGGTGQRLSDENAGWHKPSNGRGAGSAGSRLLQA